MKAKLILELEGKQYDLNTENIAIYIGKENYITVWIPDGDSFDIQLKGANNEGK